MKTNDEYRYAEHCLYSYARNKEKNERLKAELTELKNSCDVKEQSYNIQSHGGRITSPVERYIERILSIESKIARIHRQIEPVQEFEGELARQRPSRRFSQMRTILESYYIGHKSAQEVQADHKIPRWKFYVLRKEIVERVKYHV